MQAQTVTPPTIGGGKSPLPWWLAEALQVNRLGGVVENSRVNLLGKME